MINKDFILAGCAIVTLEVPADKVVENPHYTFLVERSEPNANFPESWFAKLLTGPDNTHDYTYLGMIRPDTGKLQLTRKSRITNESYLYKLLDRTLSNIWSDTVERIEQHGFKLHHEGKCGRCGRRLTTPESIERGIGPECIKMMAK